METGQAQGLHRSRENQNALGAEWAQAIQPKQN